MLIHDRVPSPRIAKAIFSRLFFNISCPLAFSLPFPFCLCTWAYVYKAAECHYPKHEIYLLDTIASILWRHPRTTQLVGKHRSVVFTN